MPEATEFHALPQKRDDVLRSVLVKSRQIDLIAKDDKPLAAIMRPKERAVCSFRVGAIVIKRFYEQIGASRAAKIE